MLELINKQPSNTHAYLIIDIIESDIQNNIK